MAAWRNAHLRPRHRGAAWAHLAVVWTPALYSAFGQSEVSLIYTQLNQYYVVLEVAPQYWQISRGLNYIYPSANSRRQRSARCGGNRQRQHYAAAGESHGTVPFGDGLVQPGAGHVAERCDATGINQMQQRLDTPSTVRGFFAGTLQAYQDSLSTEPILVVTALLAVYIVLGILYESLVHPLTIISTLAVGQRGRDAGADAVQDRSERDLDHRNRAADRHCEEERHHDDRLCAGGGTREGKNTADAIFEACMLRFRPILMTTMAALFGALPLAFGTGTGSELRRPLGITIVGG